MTIVESICADAYNRDATREHGAGHTASLKDPR